jgi:hypothetical protein
VLFRVQRRECGYGRRALNLHFNIKNGIYKYLKPGLTIGNCRAQSDHILGEPRNNYVRTQRVTYHKGLFNKHEKTGCHPAYSIWLLNEESFYNIVIKMSSSLSKQ